MARYYGGIDPGTKGGVAFLAQGEKKNVWVAELWPIPETESNLWVEMEAWSDWKKQTIVAIEKVHSMPRQSAQSGFTFGMSYGSIRMAVIAAGLPFHEVHPKTWQKGLCISPKKKSESQSQWKKRLKGIAQRLFPDLAIWEGLMKDQLAISDALLIAEYCRITY